mmetsp:Transcript_1727/g.4868  ORF Transcript_1727/g.4868 Transcript_1727/m.4868 type:complete len:195 (+) Transcript_1727:115-699(+)|eukprot:CAMPEP_0115853590 /NCGR_PEP_ID=MMETSP0287-20121206/13583_1 /TAXON_ID=412157 /ORGANISM="Chrysochromulina rotalis, Strain UIO044" /LENGTH=194 /DNA_ID=CAMNT_0003307673 /DNA_START=111 /DNA_END=695 /DNA_ORIENTATION=-
MHPGLAALAEAPAAAGRLSALVAKVKGLFTNREETRLMLGKLAITARAFASPTSFSKPQDRSEWLRRVRSNFSSFKTIYGLVFIAVMVYTVLSSPMLLCGLFILAGAWVYSFILTNQDEALTIAGFELRRREKLIVLVPFSILVVTLSGMINSLLWVLVLSSIISLPHASFHEPHELDALDQLELEGLKSGAMT